MNVKLVGRGVARRAAAPRREMRRVLPPLLLAIVCWPLSEGAGALLLRHHATFQIIVLRYTAHLLLLLPAGLLVAGPRGFLTARPGLQLLRGFCMFLMPACFVGALRSLDGGSFWSLFSCLPLLALAFARVMGEPQHRGYWVAAGLGSIGGWLIRGGGLTLPSANPTGVLLTLGAAASFAAYLALSRVLREEHLPASLLHTALGAIVPAGIIASIEWTPLLPGDFVPMLVTGLFSLLLLGGFDLALDAATLSVVAPALALVPLVESTLTTAFTARIPGLATLAGALLILAGMAVLVIATRSTRRDHAHLRPDRIFPDTIEPAS